MFSAVVTAAAGYLGVWRVTRRITRDSPRIFMFHRFDDGMGTHGVRADELHAFVNRVSKECEFVTMRELVCRLRDNERRRRPMAVITVDDGYADFHVVALPVLRRLGVNATVYATAGFIDRRCWLWWDALRYVIDAHPGGELRIQIGSDVLTATLGDIHSRQRAWSDIADWLVTRNEERTVAIQQIASSGGIVLPESPPPRFAAMTWQQLADLEEAGIEVGGHTMTHPFLPGLDPHALRAEVLGGKQLIERHLGCSLQTFAYPNGMAYDHTGEVEEAVRAAGFRAAVLAFPTVHRSNRLFQLGRWSVHPDSPMLGHVLSGASEVKLRIRRS